jgi:hypothetical protein
MERCALSNGDWIRAAANAIAFGRTGHAAAAPISNRIGSGIRNCPCDADVVALRSVRSQRCRCEIARSSC